MRFKLTPREADSHKGTFGTVLVVGGCRGMYGAPSLCGSSALASGCGLARVAVPESCLEVVAGYDRQYTTLPLPCDESGKISNSALNPILEEAQKASVIAIGPGLGQSKELDELVRVLYKKSDKPMVIDADALNALSRSSLKFKATHPRILTPHPGEFARLTGAAEKQTREEQIEEAKEMALKLSAIIVLKGHKTVVTNGIHTYTNKTGNPGMATGGAGDVLTGVIAALVAQKYDPFDAAQIGVYVHGLAGDLAARSLGQTSVTAQRILEFLPAAFKKLEKDSK
ncbi:MAG: NAD(P)H-hydrate dehydratase [Thermoguttaceae bacterium]|nr:NAD(P)H-hydrate dehydratase [Thermoguttaceae bacterium]